ncbi:hypothetical protein H4R20_002982 [Coemansia guatemalensis]|uniref:Uncharacterized protein n=1 Tax=Coemansia guatemalensis TaxID=2761395 RepID=A0A9W8HUJ5_9FUNG|nr:hypothetical protein H4R20_002982 [Coemansia guatemalensis]
MIANNILRAQLVRQSLLELSSSARPRMAIPASVAIRHFYAPQTNTNKSASANSHSSKKAQCTPQELLDKRHPAGQNEALASIIDGELDYDTDMGAAAVNNTEAERRAEALKKAEKIARETTDDFSKSNYL